MVQRVSTVAFEEIEARAVDVQVQVAPGLPLSPLRIVNDKIRLPTRQSVLPDEMTLQHSRLPSIEHKRCDTEITRAIDNRPMSSRSQALFRSITEVKHVLRQHYLP